MTALFITNDFPPMAGGEATYYSLLCGAVPPERWTRTSDTLILHGRRICKPKPLCDQCAVRDDCGYFANVVSRVRGAAPKKKRAAKKPATVRTVRS